MFPCPDCGKGPFDTAIDLRLHQKEFHSADKAVVGMDVNNTGAITAHHQPEVAVPETPEPNLSLRGALPDEFPHRQRLVDAGLDTYGKLRKATAKGDTWYEGVPGIGEKTAPSILEALAAKPEGEDEG